MRQLLPGATIGMLGSGQLGRMFTLEARRMGFHVHVLSPSEGSPTGQLADREVVAAYADADAVARFASGVDVVTLEFENIPSASLEAAAAHAEVRPGVRALRLTQHRAREKRFLAELGVPHVAYREVPAGGDLAAAVAEIGAPCVVKTAGFGYDGKGQVRVDGEGDVADAARMAAREPVVVERFVELAAELSVVAARGADGTVVAYAPAHNRHERHILDLSAAPARVPERVAEEAREVALAVLEGLDLIGVACVEFFLDADGRLLVNEIAPRPHNSGHLTIEGAETSQFEQQLRAVAGLPLGSTASRRPAAMANLLGDLWRQGEPDWAAALAVPGVALHHYGKAGARPGRKMGHLTATADRLEDAEERVLRARAAAAPAGAQT
ncbi:MAG TPA: 5-(carboxyamino)imidazole ribonucleotide synthase [Trueperaceae bacterium]|nr:5-(carboxyamino)imidazole ribonucleotide synthase [Trueperaceae bacterium]